MKQLFVLTVVCTVVALGQLIAAPNGSRSEVARGHGGGGEHSSYNRGSYEHRDNNYTQHPAAYGYGAGERRGYNAGYEQGANSSYQNSDQIYYDPEQQQMNQEYYQETQNSQQPNYNYRSYRNS